MPGMGALTQKSEPPIANLLQNVGSFIGVTRLSPTWKISSRDSLPSPADPSVGSYACLFFPANHFAHVLRDLQRLIRNLLVNLYIKIA